MFGFLSGKKDKSPEWRYEDLPTPITNDDFNKVAQEAFDNRQELTFGEIGWELYKEADGATIETKTLPGSSIKVVRSTRYVVVDSFHELVEFFYKPPFEERKLLYEDLDEYTVIREITSDIHVAHSKFKSPFFAVKGRDFLTLRSLNWGEEGEAFITIQSVNLESVPFDDKFVRGVSNCSTYLEQDEDDPKRIKIITTDFVDPRGLVPTWIVNSYLDQAGKRLWGIEQLFGEPRQIDTVRINK